MKCPHCAVMLLVNQWDANVLRASWRHHEFHRCKFPLWNRLKLYSGTNRWRIKVQYQKQQRSSYRERSQSQWQNQVFQNLENIVPQCHRLQQASAMSRSLQILHWVTEYIGPQGWTKMKASIPQGSSDSIAQPVSVQLVGRDRPSPCPRVAWAPEILQTFFRWGSVRSGKGTLPYSAVILSALIYWMSVVSFHFFSSWWSYTLICQMLFVFLTFSVLDDLHPLLS